MAQVLAEVQSELEMEAPFAQDLMFMMEMKGSAVDEIVNMLNNLKNNIAEKQIKANEEHTEKNVEWNKEIKELEGQIAQLENEIGTLTQEIG